MAKMYASDWEMVERVPQRNGLDISSALRMLLRTHPELNSNGK